MTLDEPQYFTPRREDRKARKNTTSLRGVSGPHGPVGAIGFPQEKREDTLAFFAAWRENCNVRAKRSRRTRTRVRRILTAEEMFPCIGRL